MKQLKKWIILLAIICVILIIAIVIILLNVAKQKEEFYVDPPSDDEIIPVTIDETIQREKVRNNYYCAQISAQKFLEYNMDLFGDNSLMDDEVAYEQRVIEMLYSMLDEEYIQFAQITKENLKQKMPQIKNSVVSISDIYVSQKTPDCSYYFVNGNLRSNENEEIKEFKLLLKIDMDNKTFSVFLEDYINTNGYQNLQMGAKLNLPSFEKVENKTYNIFGYQNISNEEHVKAIFSQYRNKLLYQVEEAYQNLNKEYAQKRFGTLQDYQTYVKNNYRKFFMMSLEKYQRQVLDNGITQYVCIDKDGNYYIFWETAPMQYTVILDTYTIDLPEFKEKYAQASEEEKVLMNIQKFFMAIDNQDYKYAYNKLDETYKANNFKTQQEFEEYCKNTFFASNQLGAGNGKKQEDVYVYQVTISDKSNANMQSVTKTFVMQLGEGTDFVMSFSK